MEEHNSYLYYSFLMTGLLILIEWAITIKTNNIIVHHLVKQITQSKLSSTTTTITTSPKLLLLFLLSSSPTIISATTTPPNNNLNILLFLTSAHSTGSLQPYLAPGNPLHRADRAWYGSNINWLASNSLTFDHAYTNIARSSPSRISILTSLHPRKDIQIMNDDGPANSPQFEPVRRTITLTSYLTSKGINTFASGKVFAQTDATSVYGGIPSYQVPTKGSQDVGFCPTLAPTTTIQYYPNECITPTESDLTDSEAADNAITFLRQAARKPNVPFFLLVGLYRAMGDFSRPAWAMSQLQRVTDDFLNTLRQDPLMSVASLIPFATPPQPQMSATITTVQKSRYNSVIQWTDFVVGRILDELQGLFLWDKTIIIFTSDAGYSTGEFSHVGTTSVFEHTSRVPLIIRHPGYPNSFGARTTARVELADLFPTILKLGKIPQLQKGTSFTSQIGIDFSGVIQLANVQNSANIISTRHGAVTEIPRCTATTLPYNGLPPGTLYKGPWTDTCPLSRGADVVGISYRDEIYRYTEWRAAKKSSTSNEVLIDWTLNGLFARELYNHEQDDGFWGLSQNEFERNSMNLANCPTCQIHVPGPTSNFFGTDDPPTPDLPLNPELSKIIRSYARMLRAQVRNGAPLCSGHGFYNDDTHACEYCDGGWDGDQCDHAQFPELQAGAVVPTPKPTKKPSTLKPPVGAPTTPEDTSKSPTYPFVGTPFPTSARPTFSPVPPTSLPCGDRGATNKKQCESSGDCAWINLGGGVCREITASPTTGQPTFERTDPPSPPTTSPTTYPTAKGMTSAPVQTSPPTDPPTSSPTLFANNPNRCEGIATQKQCGMINGCQWQGIIDGCATPRPVPCNCPVDLIPYKARNGQYYRNICHAQCKGVSGAGDTYSPTSTPTDSANTNLGPTTDPFPNVPGQGPAQRIQSLDLLFVVDASAVAADFYSQCVAAKGKSCWVLMADFIDHVQQTVVGFVKGGYAGTAGATNPYGLRVGLITYSCVTPYPVKTEVFLPTGSIDEINDGIRRMKTDMAPGGGRCPVAALQRMLDLDAASDTQTRPNRALVMLMQGFVNDWTGPASITKEFRARGVPTFDMLISKRREQAGGPGMTADEATRLRFQALNLAGDLSRIWNTGDSAWPVLETFVDRIVAGILTMINQPTRLAIDVGVAPAEWGPGSPDGTNTVTNESNTSTDGSSASISGIVGGFVCVGLIIVVAGFGTVAKRRATANDTSMSIEAQKMLLRFGGQQQQQHNNNSSRGGSGANDFKLVIQQRSNVHSGTPHPTLVLGYNNNNKTSPSVVEAEEQKLMIKAKLSSSSSSSSSVVNSNTGFVNVNLDDDDDNSNMTAPASPIKVNTTTTRRRSIDRTESMSSTGSSNVMVKRETNSPILGNSSNNKVGIVVPPPPTSNTTTSVGKNTKSQQQQQSVSVHVGDVL
jgi:arylsulfatase A-like enzyme